MQKTQLLAIMEGRNGAGSSKAV